MSSSSTYDYCMLWWVINLNTANLIIAFVGCIFALVCSQNTCFLSILIHNLLLNKLLLLLTLHSVVRSHIDWEVSAFEGTWTSSGLQTWPWTCWGWREGLFYSLSELCCFIWRNPCLTVWMMQAYWSIKYQRQTWIACWIMCCPS